MPADDLYIGREQTKIKHFILSSYLCDFAQKIASKWKTITYIDCFSGPWNVQSPTFEDSSIGISIRQLRKARETHPSLKLRCMFLERDPQAYTRLKSFTDSITDIAVETRNCELVNARDDVLQFIAKGGSEAFPFIFIDPTGWTGFEMELIGPLLRVRPGEVLINFMTDHIRRFIMKPPTDALKKQFRSLFSSPAVFDRIQKRVQECDNVLERERILFSEYAEDVKNVGNFAYRCTAYVLNPGQERSYFHLIYATRHPEGVKVFKRVEKRALAEMERTRANVDERKQIEKTGQPLALFATDDVPPSHYVVTLRSRFLDEARERTEHTLTTSKRVSYDDLWRQAMEFPLVWESDLKDWLSAWQKKGILAIPTLKPGQRVPQVGQKHELVWKSQSPK